MTFAGIFAPFALGLALAALSAPAGAQGDHPDHGAIVARMKAMDAIHVLPIATLKQRSAAGDLRATYALSLRYQNGLEVKRSYAEYERLFARAVQAGAAAAAGGDSYAMYLIALDGALNKNWPDDRRLAAYRLAAEAGSPDAAEQVGFAYYWGRGARANPDEALRWYLKGAAGGSCEAMRMAASILSDPKHGAPDVVEAVRWYRIAAENQYGCGNGANYALALLYAEGRGNLPRDYAQARTYLIECYRRGNPVGAMQLGFYHEKGLGGPVNKAEALKWFRIAGYNSLAAARAELARLGVPEPE